MIVSQNTAKLAFMLTRECGFRCGYCGVAKSRPQMTKELLLAGLDFLFDTEAREVKAMFCGGEPLLRFELIKAAVEQGRQKAETAGKRFDFSVSTNGLPLDRKKAKWLLDNKCELGVHHCGTLSTHRLMRMSGDKGLKTFECVNERLAMLADMGAPFHVNLFVSPVSVRCLDEALENLGRLGVSKAQIFIQIGVLWPDKILRSLMKTLEALRMQSKSRPVVSNFEEPFDPVLLADEPALDSDGKLYRFPAVFFEKYFPRLKRTLFEGNLPVILHGPTTLFLPLRGGRNERRGWKKKICAGIDSLCISRKELMRRVLSAHPPDSGKGKLLRSNLKTGLALENFYRKNTTQPHGLPQRAQRLNREVAE